MRERYKQHYFLYVFNFYFHPLSEIMFLFFPFFSFCMALIVYSFFFCFSSLSSIPLNLSIHPDLHTSSLICLSLKALWIPPLCPLLFLPLPHRRILFCHFSLTLFLLHILLLSQLSNSLMSFPLHPHLF